MRLVSMFLMATAVVLDLSTDYWCNQPTVQLKDVVELVLVALRASSLQHSWENQPAFAIIAAFPDSAEYLYSGVFDEAAISLVNETLRLKLQHRADVSGVSGESLISQALCMASCFVRKNGKRGRILLFETSANSNDFSKQSVEVSNCGWALSQEEPSIASVDVISLGGPKRSSILVNLSRKTGGTCIPPSLTRSAASILQSILFLSTTQIEGFLKLIQSKAADSLDMGAVCTCHANPIDCGYVCSVCLAVYCSETSAVCSVCGSRIRREIRDELPLYQKAFSQLLP